VKYCSALLLFLILAPGAGDAQQIRTLVLVTGADSTIPLLSDREIRKLYLGVQVTKNGQRLTPLRNLVDPLLEEVFLQKVIFLSARAYEDQLLSRVFRLGGLRPISYDNQERLVEALHVSSNAVTYMWATDVYGEKRLKKIGELWSGQIN